MIYMNMVLNGLLPLFSLVILNSLIYHRLRWENQKKRYKTEICLYWILCTTLLDPRISKLMSFSHMKRMIPYCKPYLILLDPSGDFLFSGHLSFFTILTQKYDSLTWKVWPTYLKSMAHLITDGETANPPFKMFRKLLKIKFFTC